MQKLLTVLIVILAVLVLAVLVLAVIGTYPQLADLMAAGHAGQQLSLLPAVAISAGVLVAILTFARERRRQEQDRDRHMSEVFLERAVEGFKTAIDLLRDKNNSRISWVRAARTILNSVELGRQITSHEYKVAYRLEEERARNELYLVLSVLDEKTGQRTPLPPQFFYGIPDWNAHKSLDDAAIAASNSAIAYSPSIDEVPPQSHLRPISPRSVIAIFDFLKYPDEYEDPLKSVGDWSDNWEDSFDIDQGARRYVAHAKSKFAVDGKIHERAKR